mgnify:CR=1 FL=1
MASLLSIGGRGNCKFYREFWPSKQAQEAAKLVSSTVYVGNLSFFTTEAVLTSFFSTCGKVERVVMGLNRLTKKPCGFCFVAFSSHDEAATATDVLSGMELDSRPVRIAIDWGFSEGRQYGRSRGGGQIRDELRTSFDADRGGHGLNVKEGFIPGVDFFLEDDDPAPVRHRGGGGGGGRGGRRGYRPYRRPDHGGGGERGGGGGHHGGGGGGHDRRRHDDRRYNDRRREDDRYRRDAHEERPSKRRR